MQHLVVGFPNKEPALDQGENLAPSVGLSEPTIIIHSSSFFFFFFFFFLLPTTTHMSSSVLSRFHLHLQKFYLSRHSSSISQARKSQKWIFNVLLSLLGLGSFHNPDSFSDSEENLLSVAKRGDFDKLRTILNEGQDPNVKNDFGLTALHNTAKERSYKIAELVLDYGADPNARDKTEMTPLHYAAQNGHDRTVQLLLEYWADPNAKFKILQNKIFGDKN